MKMMKRTLSLALALTMVLALTLVYAPTAYAAGYTANFGAQFNPDVNGDLGEWFDTADYGGRTAFVEGDEYTMTLEFPSTVAFGGNYAAIDTNFPYTPDALGTILSFKLDGNEVSMSDSLTQDEGGNVRLTLCNKWNSDISEQPVDLETLGEFSKIEVTFTVSRSGGIPAPVVEAVPVPEFDPNGTYKAYFGIQMDNWIFRDAWDSPLGDPDGPDGSSWADFDRSYFNELFDTTNGLQTGTINDAVIEGNGTYRVSVTDWDFKDASEFNQLYVSTNIPLAGENLKFTDIKVILGGSTRHTFRDAYILGIDSDDAHDYYRIGCLNRWNTDLWEIFNDALPAEGEIAIEFTVSGFAYDNASAADEPAESTPAPAAATPAPTPAPADTDDGGISGLLIGLIIGGVVLIAAVVVFVVMKKNKK